MKPLIKLCGNHSEHDTHVSLNSQSDYVGFVFAESKRRVERKNVQKWLEQNQHHQKKIVALFVNETVETIKASVKGLAIDIIQCHGQESVEQIKEIKQEVGLPVWKVIHHHEEAILDMQVYKGEVDGFVIDCKVGKQLGGTGVSFDWTYVPAYIEEGRRQQVPVFIAGGIKPSNIDELLSYQPDGIDVSSGIEENGQKSASLILQLEERVKNYAK